MSEQDEATRLAETVLKQGELKLSSQLTIALAADVRATAFAGVFIALAAAAIGAGATILSISGAHWALISAAFVAAGFLLWSGFLCISVSKPVEFYVVGNQPDNWWNDNVDKKPLAECFRTEAANYQARITKNNAILAKNAEKIERALRLGWASPLIAAVVWVLVQGFLWRS